MSSHTELKKGFYRVDACLRFGTNETNIILPLSMRLEDVVEMTLYEYSIVAPNGGAIEPSLWRLSFPDLLIASHISNFGQGHPFVIDNAVCTHVVYDTPRTVSVTHKGWLNSLRVQMYSNGVAPTFTSATFFISFLCRDKQWIPTDHRTDREFPQFPHIQFAGRGNVGEIQ